MTTVAVQTFVIDPIWKSESAVASTPVSRLSDPGGGGHDGAVAQHRDGRARHVVLLAQVVEPFLERRAIDRERHGLPPGGRG